MRVLVTGGQGCIGAWVIKRLLDRGIDVLMFDIDPTPIASAADRIRRRNPTRHDQAGSRRRYRRRQSPW